MTLRAWAAAAAVLCSVAAAACRIGYDPASISDGGGGSDTGARLDGAVRDAGDADGAVVVTDGGGGLDGGPPPDGCVPALEECNRLDDDCDGAIDETWAVVSSFAECSGPARLTTFDLVAFTWDQADAIRSASVSSGMLEDRPIVLSPALPAGIDTSRAVGNLLGYDMPMVTVFVPFPETGGDLTIEPNATRVEIELGWGGFEVPNGPGDDVIVYETGEPITEPEAFAVAFRNARTGVWSAFRYEQPDGFDSGAELFVTAFDLGDFGPAVADAMRVANVFNAEAASGEDRVTGASGEGVVIRAGEPGWDTASPLLTPAGAPYATPQLDTDLIYVVSLHPTVAARCCPP